MRKHLKVGIFTLFSLAVVYVVNLLDNVVFASLESIDAALGFAVLASLSGISKYNNFIPGIVIGMVLGFIQDGIPGVVINTIPLLTAMFYYKKLLYDNPLSPLNVYKSSALGALSHALLTSLWHSYAVKYFITEFIVAMLIVKSIVNILREEGLINHEDPKLVAKLERDYLDLLYKEINKVFKTNLQRPIKPKGEINK